jgi:hypothetical protein
MVRCKRSMAVAITVLGLAAGCARPTSPPPETPARVKDSAPDKIAAQRAAAAPSLNLEGDDERWGIEAARERKAAAPPETPPSSPDATGPKSPKPLDLHTQP